MFFGGGVVGGGGGSPRRGFLGEGEEEEWFSGDPKEGGRGEGVVVPQGRRRAPPGSGEGEGGSSDRRGAGWCGSSGLRGVEWCGSAGRRPPGWSGSAGRQGGAVPWGGVVLRQGGSGVVPLVWCGVVPPGWTRTSEFLDTHTCALLDAGRA